MIPYVMPYIERMGYDKFIVYDNESTDNTVELLKQYPFVEVRTYSTNKVNDVVSRTKLMADSFTEVHELKNKNNGEIIWMSWTDFDEVIFPIHLYRNTLKEILEWEYFNYNVFESSMVNLFPPKNISQRKMLKYVKKGYFVHEIPEIRCKMWDNWLGHKTLLIKINDFSKIMCYNGNHQCGLQPGTGKTIRKIYDHTDFSSGNITKAFALKVKYWLVKDGMVKQIRRERDLQRVYKSFKKDIRSYMSVHSEVDMDINLEFIMSMVEGRQ
jgi:hypothetical protein